MKRKHMKLLGVLFPFLLFGQNNSGNMGTNEPCGEQEVLEQMLISDPKAYAQYVTETAKRNKPADPAVQKMAGTIYTIPVVFHHLHDNGPSNISNAQILEALDILNRDFRKLNADANTVHSDFLSRVGDAEIEFKLATNAPDGTCFSGITRTVATSNSTDGLDQVNQIVSGNNIYQGVWDHTKYLNIIIATDLGGAAGYTWRPYTTFNVPTSSNMRYNSIFILSHFVGASGTSNAYYSRALTHEVGHWLDLLHTWGAGNSPGQSCGGDDFVSDTPETRGSITCNLNENTCGTRANVENYMDYSYCFKMFTTGQVNRMRAAITGPLGGRNNIWTQNNLIATGVGNSPALCSTNISVSTTNSCTGKQVTFSVSGLPSSTGNTYNWSFPGGTPSTSTSANPTVVFNSTGVFRATLTVNTSVGSKTMLSPYVTVTVGPSAPTASAQTFCGTATVASLTGTGTNLKWYSAATGGTALASTATLSTGTYYVSQTTNSCESTRTSVNVTVNSVPAAPTATTQTFCGTATVANLTGSGTNLKWYSTATGGTALASTAPLSTGTYYVSQTTNSCESTRTSVNVTVNSVPAAPTASAQTFCGTATVANLTGTGTNLK